jgi:hypothetical protein
VIRSMISIGQYGVIRSHPGGHYIGWSICVQKENGFLVLIVKDRHVPKSEGYDMWAANTEELENLLRQWDILWENEN